MRVCLCGCVFVHTHTHTHTHTLTYTHVCACAFIGDSRTTPRTKELVLKIEVQKWGIVVDGLPTQVALDLVEADVGNDGVELPEELFILDHEEAAAVWRRHAHTRRADAREEEGPVDRGRNGLQLGQRHAAAVLVPLLGARRHGLCHGRLKLQRVVSILLRLVLRSPRQHHNVLYQLPVRRAVPLHLLGLFCVVGLVRHGDAALRHEEAVDGRVLAVGIHPPAPEHIDIRDGKLH